MNTMTYKGYLGSVAFSEKDNVFFGKIEGINGLVNFEGESVKELTEAFHEAVDDYLAYCEEEGIEPDKSYSGVLNVRLTPAIHRQIAILARQAGGQISFLYYYNCNTNARGTCGLFPIREEKPQKNSGRGACSSAAVRNRWIPLNPSSARIFPPPRP